MEFQNTIAYGQFYNAGGVVAITTDYVALAFTPIVNLAKNIHIANDLGGENVPNGDFPNQASVDYWQIASDRATKSLGDGFMRLTYNIATGSALYKNSIAPIDKSYLVTFRAKGTTNSNFVAIGENSSVGDNPINPTLVNDWQDYKFIVPLLAITFRFYLDSASIDDTFDITNISIREQILTNDFGVYVEQTGSYFLDFSFIAEGGDNKGYSFAPFINGVEQLGSIDFYQQATAQEYEVGSNYIFDLTEGDFISFKVKTASVSTIPFIIKDIKLNIFNLQQLGIH